MKRFVPVVLLVSLAAAVRAGVDPSSAAVALPVAAPVGAELVHVELPPAVFAAAERGAGDVRVVDAAGELVPHVLLTRDGSADTARADLEPLIAQRSAGRSEVALLIDLRVLSAPGLALELDLEGPAGMPLHVSDAADPRTGPWEELHFQPTEVADGRLSGRAVVPAGAGRRFLRVIVPTPRPFDVSVARLAATIPRHRVFFRTEGRPQPFLVLAGVGDAPSVPAWPHESVQSWSAGESGSVEAPAWLPAERPAPASDEEIPFPWAELVATALVLALTIWAVLLRKEG